MEPELGMCRVRGLGKSEKEKRSTKRSSTLLKTVFGIAAVSDGSVSLGGESLLGLSPSAIVRKGVSFVPQLANVFASLSVQENLEMGAFAYRRGGGHR